MTVGECQGAEKNTIGQLGDTLHSTVGDSTTVRYVEPKVTNELTAEDEVTSGL